MYENSNYTSDNIVDNTRLLETARKFVDRAKQQLAIACVPQISITATVSSLLVQSEIPNEELFDDFAIGNYIRVSIDDTVYKLRIIGIKYDFENLEKVEVTFSNVTKSLFGAMSDIQSILQQASSIATSFSSVAKQAENGQVAAQKFEHIKKEGLDSSLGSVKAAKNQEIIVDDNGILCRYYNKWLNQYDDRQLKIVNQNIVMTDDAWENAKLAIGLGQYNGEAKWGVWADMLVGDLMITKDLKVINKNDKGETSVEINEDGITLDGGAITWKNSKLKIQDVDELDTNLFDLDKKITDGDKTNSDALASYKEEISKFQTDVKGSLGVTNITSTSVISPKIGGGYLYISKDGCSVEIDPSQKYKTSNSKVINVQASNSDVFYVERDGSAYFKGKITATSGKIQKGCIIGSWQVGDTKNTGRDGWLSCNSSFNNGVIDSGISWFIDDSEHFYNYGTVMNGVSFEYYSYGLKPESTILKFRFNSYSNAVNDKNKNCMYANVGYIGLNSTGNIDLNSTGSGNMYLNTYNNGSIYLDTHNTAGSINFMSETHCNSNLILTKPYTKLAGYNNAQTACFDLVQLTEYTSGANHVRLGSEALNTEIYGASIYLKVSSAVYVNDVPVHSSDRNIKKEISSIDEKYDTFFNKLNPVTYKFIDGQSGRFHSGFISQEIEEALIQSGLTTNDFAGFVKYNDPKTNDEKYGLRYEEFIALNTHMIQKLYKRIEVLEEKINSLVDN